MLLWLTFAAAVVAIVAGTVVAVVRGVRLWRAARQTSSRFGEALDQIEQAAAEFQVHLDAAEAGATRLGEASERLRRSRARLDVESLALPEARAMIRRLLDALPSGG
jgi:hypothetical protein